MIDKYTGKKLDGRYEIQELIGVGGIGVTILLTIEKLQSKS